MSNIEYMKKRGIHYIGNCFACESPRVHAEWTGRGFQIFICNKCAKKVLPVLFADATYSEKPCFGFAALMDTFLHHYWRATALLERKQMRKHGSLL